MKSKKMFTIYLLIFALLTSLTACGGKTTDPSGQQASSQQTADQQEADQQATDLQAAAEQVVPAADPTASVNDLIGSWTDISSTDRFANITNADTEYQYEDNDGKYSATFKDGVLKVKVSDSETADVYLDEKTGHMLVVYQGEPAEFSKKQP